MSDLADLEQLIDLENAITKHLGRSDFGIYQHPFYWEKLLLGASRDAALFFGKSEDSIEVENLLRGARMLSASIDELKPGTRKLFDATSEGKKKRIHTMLEQKPQSNMLDDVEEALLSLISAAEELKNNRSIKNKASKAPNWRAAAVAGVCRTLWAAAKWEEENRPLPPIAPPQPFITCEQHQADIHQEEDELISTYSEYLKSAAPRTEKHDCPGPFGRFVEDVFVALDIKNARGKAYPAASALRALASNS